MFNWFYRLPLSYVTIFMLAFITLYSIAHHRFSLKRYGLNTACAKWFRIFNFLTLIVSIYIILSFTVLMRDSYVDKLVIRPFYSFSVAKIQPEIYRSMLMNVALFVPFGASLSVLWNERIPALWRIVLTSLLGCVLSFAIESIQYVYKLGEAWTDDVICNVLGAFLGSLSIVIWKLYYLINNKFY